MNLRLKVHLWNGFIKELLSDQNHMTVKDQTKNPWLSMKYIFISIEL